MVLHDYIYVVWKLYKSVNSPYIYSWAPPAFLERGGGGGGGGQDRVRVVPFDSREYVVCFRPIQPAGVRGVRVCVCCQFSAAISEVSATLLADPVILSVGGGCCPLSMRMYVNFYYKGEGGGAMAPPPWGCP